MLEQLDGIFEVSAQIGELRKRDKALHDLFTTFNTDEPFGLNIEAWRSEFNVERGGVLNELTGEYHVFGLGFGRRNGKGKIIEGTDVLTAPKRVLREQRDMMVHSLDTAGYLAFLVGYFNDAPQEKLDILTNHNYDGNTFKGYSPEAAWQAAVISHFMQRRAFQDHSPGIAWLQRAPDLAEWLRFLEGRGVVWPELRYSQYAELMHKAPRIVRKFMVTIGMEALFSGADWATKVKPISLAQGASMKADLLVKKVNMDYLEDIKTAKENFFITMEAVEPGLIREMRETKRSEWAARKTRVLDLYDRLSAE